MEENIREIFWQEFLTFFVEDILGHEMHEQWLENEIASLGPIAPEEELLPFELTDWQKKLFQLSDLLNKEKAKINEKHKDQQVIDPDKLSEEDKADLKKIFVYDRIGGAVRALFWGVIWQVHPEAIGKFNIGVRKGYAVVKVPAPPQPEIVRLTPGGVQDLLKQITGMGKPGRFN